MMRKSDIVRIHSVMERIVEHLKLNIPQKELAKNVNIPLKKLKKGFKAEFNKSIHKFILEERMKKAKELLLENELSIKQIAAEVGYPSLNSFINIFKREIGITPRKFQKTKGVV